MEQPKKPSPRFPDSPKWELPVDDTTQELTEIERGKDPENDEAEYWDKKIKDREEFSRKAVMKWRENGSIS